MLGYENLRLFRVGKGGNRPNTSVPSSDVAPPGDGGSNVPAIDGLTKPCPSGDVSSCRVDFSSLCYFYGRDIYEMLTPKRPIGLIGSYVGGTPDEAWSSPDALAKCLNPVGPPPPQKTAYSSLWNSMIVPLTRTTIKGAIWVRDVSTADLRPASL